MGFVSISYLVRVLLSNHYLSVGDRGTSSHHVFELSDKSINVFSGVACESLSSFFGDGQVRNGDGAGVIKEERTKAVVRGVVNDSAHVVVVNQRLINVCLSILDLLENAIKLVHHLDVASGGGFL